MVHQGDGGNRHGVGFTLMPPCTVTVCAATTSRHQEGHASRTAPVPDDTGWDPILEGIDEVHPL